MKKIYILSLIFLGACSTVRQPVTKDYTIKSKTTMFDGRSFFEINGLRGQYFNLADTLKVGDTITITWLNRIK